MTGLVNGWTHEQRMAALERANVIRYRRAQLKRDLKAGRAQLHDLIVDPPDWLESAKIADLLVHVPKIGRGKVVKIMRACSFSAGKQLGELTQRQRNELVEHLPRTQAGGLSRPPRDYPEVDPRGQEHTP